MERIALGDRVKDQISGFCGIVVAITVWLNGCRRITIQPEAMHEGKLLENQTFDEHTIMVIAPAVFPSSASQPDSPTPLTPALTARGGPRPEPQRAADPR